MHSESSKDIATQKLPEQEIMQKKTYMVEELAKESKVQMLLIKCMQLKISM